MSDKKQNVLLETKTCKRMLELINENKYSEKYWLNTRKEEKLILQMTGHNH